MSDQIKLTVTERSGQVVANESCIFDVKRMVQPKTSGNGVMFFYPDKNGNMEEIKCSESLDTVVSMAAVTDNSAGQKKKLTLLFDATGGKAIGTYACVDFATGAAAQLPDNARITRSWYEVLTTFTSATDAGTIELGIDTDSAAAIKAAIAISNGGNPWDQGLHEGIQDGTAANFSVKATAARNINAVVAVEALTAGKLILEVEYEILG